MFSPLKMRAFGVTAALLLCVHQCAAVLKELHSVTDSISYTKSAETVVIGIFQDKKSDQFKMFKQVCAGTTYNRPHFLIHARFLVAAGSA
jgi:hypothetical protein